MKKSTSKIITLHNGLRVCLVNIPYSQTLTCFLMIGVGTKSEHRHHKGISHLLEHCVFQGTSRYPTYKHISHVLDRQGEANAMTFHDYTGYYVHSGFNDSFKEILPVLGEIYANPTLDEQRVRREKKIVANEIKMYKDDPGSLVDDLGLTALYGDQPAGWLVIGEHRDVMRISTRELHAFRRRHYIPAKTVLVIAGRINKKAVIREVNRHFGQIPYSEPGKKIDVIDHSRRKRVVKLYQNTQQTHLKVLVRTVGCDNPDEAAFRVLSTMLTSGSSSRMYVALRELGSVCYHISGDQESSTNHGNLFVTCNPDNGKTKKAVSVIMDEFSKLKRGYVPNDELEKAKKNIVSAYRREIQDSYGIALHYAESLIIKGSVQTQKRFEDTIMSVSASQINRIAKSFFIDRNLALAVIGPHRSREKFEKILTLG